VFGLCDCVSAECFRRICFLKLKGITTMATQITSDARLRAISAAYGRNDKNEIVVKDGENFETIFARALGMVDLKLDQATESQRNSFRNSFPTVRSEVYAGSCTMTDDEGNPVNALEYLSAKKIKKSEMLKKLESTFKDRVTVPGKLLPTPTGFGGTGKKGRQAVNAVSYFNEI
jgi:hypothetical protein